MSALPGCPCEDFRPPTNRHRSFACRCPAVRRVGKPGGFHLESAVPNRPAYEGVRLLAPQGYDTPAVSIRALHDFSAPRTHMPLRHYGVLIGRAVDRRIGTGANPHYQVHLVDDQDAYRIAVNVRSRLSPPDL